MRVLVVDSNRVDVERTLRLLGNCDHDVRVAADADAALGIVRKGAPDVVLVESTMSGSPANDLVKRIRACERDSHVYVIVTAARAVPGDVRTAFLAGADDFIRKPCGKDELLARIDGPQRIRRWASRVFTGAGLADGKHCARLAASPIWSASDVSVCSEVSEMLGAPLTGRLTSDALVGVDRLTTVRLALVAEKAEVALAVGVDASTVAHLAEAMFGTPVVEEAAAKDMMREFANLAAGAVKRLAATEGWVLTMGIPEEVNPASFRKPEALARRDWVGAADDGTLALHFALELRSRVPKMVRAAALCEGMVVASDLRNTAGALLMRAGTRVTESQLWGLAHILGAENLVEIVDTD